MVKAGSTEKVVPLLCFAGTRRLPGQARSDAHTGCAVSPDDAGEDRTLSPVDEERREAREVLPPADRRGEFSQQVLVTKYQGHSSVEVRA